GKFPKVKLDWIISKTGHKLELDGYNEEQQLAFEYQGPHHRSVDSVILHDEIKREACSRNNVRLIEVEAIKRPYPAENVLSKVCQAFEKYGIKEKPFLPPVEIFVLELEELRELAREKGGKLVSVKYLGSEAHEWKCGIPEHPSWWAESWRI